MEVLLRVLQDLVALTLAFIGIGVGVRTALGDVALFRRFPVRVIASLLFLAVGLWVFYTGIRHMVAG